MKIIKSILLFICVICLIGCSTTNHNHGLFGASGGGGGGSGGGGAPSGAAGGDLGSTYPNPTVVSGANILGVIGKVNARGTITNGNSFDCDMSLGNICTATAAQGATITANTPSNGVLNVQYYLIVYSGWTSAGGPQLAFGTGWAYYNVANAADSGTPTNVVLPVVNGAPVIVPFHWDGTKYRFDEIGQFAVYKVYTQGLSVGSTGILSTGAIGVIGSSAITTQTGAMGANGGGSLQSWGGTAPTLTAGCNGTGASVVAGTNTAGHFTTQTAAATTCTLTFSASGPFHAAPDCMFYDDNADATPVAFSTGAVSTASAVVDFTSLTAVQIGYICIGH